MKLNGIRFRDLLGARFRKVILDMTSVKFEFIVFVGYAIWEGKIPAHVGLPVMMVTLGIKEYVDFIGKKVESITSNGG
jgi:hypothetical protein